MAAELAIINARVRTLDPAQPFAEAVAVRGGTIVAVGDDAAVREHCDARTEVLDARGNALSRPGGLAPASVLGRRARPRDGSQPLRDARGGARRAGGERAPARLAVRLGSGLRRRADAGGDRRGGRRRGRVRAALRHAHGACLAACAPARPGHRPARLRDGSSEVVCVDGVPTGELHETGAQDLVLRAAPGLRWPEHARAPRRAAAAPQRARPDRRARDGRRARDARPAARPRRHRGTDHAPARAAMADARHERRGARGAAAAARRARAAVARRRREVLRRRRDRRWHGLARGARHPRREHRVVLARPGADRRG